MRLSINFKVKQSHLLPKVETTFFLFAWTKLFITGSILVQNSFPHASHQYGASATHRQKHHTFFGNFIGVNGAGVNETFYATLQGKFERKNKVIVPAKVQTLSRQSIALGMQHVKFSTNTCRKQNWSHVFLEPHKSFDIRWNTVEILTVTLVKYFMH